MSSQVLFNLFAPFRSYLKTTATTKISKNKDTQVMVFVMDSLANSFRQQPVLGIYLPTE